MVNLKSPPEVANWPQKPTVFLEGYPILRWPIAHKKPTVCSFLRGGYWVAGGSPLLIVAKKWDPGILDPSRFLGQIRKVQARLGKLAKIRKVVTN